VPEIISVKQHHVIIRFNPLNAELNPICHLLALLGSHRILHVRRIKVNHLNAELNPICHLLALLGAHRFLHVSRIKVKTFQGVCIGALSNLKEAHISVTWNTFFGPRLRIRLIGHLLLFSPVLESKCWGCTSNSATALRSSFFFSVTIHNLSSIGCCVNGALGHASCVNYVTTYIPETGLYTAVL